MSESTYTLKEARRELRRRECAAAGHAPSVHLATVSNRVGRWICDCGAVTWRPSDRAE